MNKICSFLIIIITIYLTYDYCSRITEGQTTAEDIARRKKEREEADKSIPTTKCNAPKLTTIDDQSTNTEPCAYENVSCRALMDKITTDDWGDSFHKNTNIKETSYKTQCNLCVQGSKVDGNTRFVLANVGAPVGKTNKAHVSNFADDLCDAMAANCESQIFYANNRQDGWEKDCQGVDKTSWADNKLNKVVCVLLTNSILQFFLGFMGGLECTLKIKAYEIEGKMAAAWKHRPKMLGGTG
jgi:hypothetical protein